MTAEQKTLFEEVLQAWEQDLIEQIEDSSRGIKADDDGFQKIAAGKIDAYRKRMEALPVQIKLKIAVTKDDSRNSATRYRAEAVDHEDWYDGWGENGSEAIGDIAALESICRTDRLVKSPGE